MAYLSLIFFIKNFTVHTVLAVKSQGKVLKKKSLTQDGIKNISRKKDGKKFFLHFVFSYGSNIL